VNPRIGLLLPQYDCTIDMTVDAARAADELGLDMWLAGQLFPISSRPENAAFEPLSLMGAIAALTARSRLGFMALAAPYLPHVYLAKALLTLDHVSGGRLDVGLGAGWRAEEFRALGRGFGDGAERRRRLEEAISSLTELAAGRPDGTHRVSSGPRSVQRPHPPLWIAGRGPKLLDLAGRRADWANVARGISAEDCAAAGAQIAAAAAAAGRDQPPRMSLTGTFLTAADEDALDRVLLARAAHRGVTPENYVAQLRAANVFVGTAAEIGSQLSRYVAAGCDAFILWPLDANYADAPASLAAIGAATDGRAVG
jgi:alkanesulfonate monooxygenase SsuD/methylene tetrahydromethanopterin reductase-like flavin-dependent oxidoreductase (luciferase family)